jgi:hypothetical protein
MTTPLQSHPAVTQAFCRRRSGYREREMDQRWEELLRRSHIALGNQLKNRRPDVKPKSDQSRKSSDGARHPNHRLRESIRDGGNSLSLEQGKKLGKRLVTEVIARLRPRGFHCLSLATGTYSPRAVRVYEACGFQGRWQGGRSLENALQAPVGCRWRCVRCTGPAASHSCRLGGRGT